MPDELVAELKSLTVTLVATESVAVPNCDGRDEESAVGSGEFPAPEVLDPTAAFLAACRR